MSLPQYGGNAAFQDVRLFGIQRRNGDRHQRPWIVRWSIDRRQHSRSFATKATAERFRADLLLAEKVGGRFDLATGLPETWRPADNDDRVDVWARRWVGEQWAEWAPRTRSSALESLSRFLPLLVKRGAPSLPLPVRKALIASLVPMAPQLPEVERHFRRWGLSLGDLNRELLADVDQRLGLADDGRLLSPTTAARRRNVSRACIRRAVELRLIADDPWPPPPRGRSNRKSVRAARRRPKVRSLPDPTSMARVIEALRNHQPASRRIQVMTAVAYYAGLRPSEVVMLRVSTLYLPDHGWGSIRVVEADVSFDEPGEPKTGPRNVPIPAVLVRVLAEWVAANGLDGDALLFRTASGGCPSASNWGRALHGALRKVGLPAMRVYDCRHAAATTWLRAGVPLGEVALRMGHSVETLVRTYVGALQDDAQVANERIDMLLGLRPGEAGN